MADVNEDIKVAAFDGQFKFRMEPMDDFDPEDLQEFINKLTSGKGKAYFKSAPVPKKQEGPVLSVVADSFVDEILNSKKDVLIEFYAPWYLLQFTLNTILLITKSLIYRCGHCKALEPDFKKLAKKMKKENPNLIVAKMDATANDVHPIFGVLKGYPTLFFLPVGQKQDPVQYQGSEFSYKSLKDFVDQQSSVILTDEERMGLPSSILDSTNEGSKEHKMDEL